MLIYIYEYVGMVRCMYLYLEEAGFWAVTPWPASWCSVGGGGSVYSAYCLHPLPSEGECRTLGLHTKRARERERERQRAIEVVEHM